MPFMKVAPDLEMHYLIDDFTDPWKEPDTVLLLHGFSEASVAWYAAVPQLARRFRVVRPDMRGFGESTPMPRDYPWSLDTIIEDFVSLMRGLKIERFHLIGGKVGGTIAMCFAARRPQFVRTLSVLGSPVTGGGTVAARIPSWLEHVEKHGVESWARWTMPGRLGSAFPKEGAEWWAQMMGRTAPSSHMGFASIVPTVDATPDLPRIACPTLVITTEGSDIASVEETRQWQKKIPHSRLVALPGDSFRIAATDGDRCAREILSFIDSVQ